MKKLLFALAFFLCAAPAFAAITIGDTSHDFTGGSNTTASSTAKNHAAGNAIAVACSTYAFTGAGATGAAVTNTAGDTFVSNAGAKRTSATDQRVEWWWVFSSNGNASDVVTCTWDAAVGSPTIVTVEFTHTGTLTFDTASVSTGESSVMSYPVQQFSTAAAGLILFKTQRDGGTSTTPPATPAFTSTGDDAYNTSYRITGGAETNITPAATDSTASNYASVAVSFTESGGGTHVPYAEILRRRRN